MWLGQGTGASYSLSPTKLCVDAGQFRGAVAPGIFGIRYASKTIDAHALMDVNGDGVPDLAKPDPISGVLDVWLGFPTRDAGGNLTGFGYEAKRNMTVPRPFDALSGLDLNGDGFGGDYAALGDLVSAYGSVVYSQGVSFTGGYPWTSTQWASGSVPVSANVQVSATLPVARNQFTCPPAPASPAGSFNYGVHFDDPRKSLSLTDLNGDGRPDLLVRPSPSDCNSWRACTLDEFSFVMGGQCYDPNVACPLVVYWNTGGGFERGGTIQAPADLFPSVSYAPVSPDNAGVQCLYCWQGTIDPYAYLELYPQAGTSTFTAWSADFIDLNGDGVPDYATNRGGVWTFFKGNNVAPLLNKVTTAAGAIYLVTYGQGTTYQAGPLDGARDVVTQVVLSGTGIPTATTNYGYASPVHGPNPANFGRVEPRGFGESWSWLAEQGTGDKVAKHVTWITASSVLASSPSRIEWGTFSGAEPSGGGFIPFKRTDLDYLVKSLDTGTCVASNAEISASAFPVMPITSLERSLDKLDSIAWLGSGKSRACGDVDGTGNVLKTNINANGTWDDSLNSFAASDSLVDTWTFDPGSVCTSCPKVHELKDGTGATLAATSYYYDSPVGTWASPIVGAGNGHLNYVSQWVSATRSDVASAQAYNVDGTVQYRKSDPFPGSHALSTTESYTYDAQQLRVTLTTRTDGQQTVLTSAAYDTKGLLASQSGPYLTGGEASAPTQAFARDDFGRVVAVGRSVSFNGTTGTTTVTGAIAAIEYVDTSPPMVRSYSFLAPLTFNVGAIPATPDVKQVVGFKDILGRTTEVRERLGVAGTANPSSQVIQALSGYRVVSLVKYDAAGRVVGSLEPSFAADGSTPSQFATVAAVAGIRGAMTVFDATGRVACTATGVYSAMVANPTCTLSTGNDMYFQVGTAFTYGSVAGASSARLAAVTVKAPGFSNVIWPIYTVDTVTTFRADGKVQDVIDPSGNTVTTNYDLLGRAYAVTRKTAGLSAVATSTRTLDGLGRVTDEWDDNWSPGAAPSRIYTYDQVGRAYSIQLAPQPVGATTVRPVLSYEFKSMGRPTKVSVTEQNMPSRQLAAFAYDLPYNNNGALYTNTAGRLSSVLSSNTSIALGYDQNGQAIRRDQWIAGLTGAFTLTGAISDDGRMLAGSFFSGYSKTVNYFGRYDSAGRPVRVDAGGASAGAAPVVNLWEVRNATNTSYDGYDLLGRVGRLRSNGGTVDTYRNYDTYTGALSSQATTLASGTKAYGIDSILYVGTKLRSFSDTTVPGTVTSHGYTYDEAGRLATAKASRVGPAAISQGYGQSYSATDPAWQAGASMENLERAADVSGTTDYAYQGDRATQLTGAVSATLGYDFAGRAWSRVSNNIEVEGFVHDVLDRLTQIRRNGALSEILEYAPTGEPLFRKLGTQGTWYVGAVATVTGTVPASCYDTTSCVPVAGTVKVAAHVQVAGGRVASVKAAAGSGLDPVTDVLYYHRDMQGSVVATTYRAYGYSGSLGARYRYTPYGQLDRAENVSALSDSELGYTGGLRLGYVAGVAQQGNLVLLGARVYHAELKRWLVPDTVDGRRYTYAGGDPVNFVDPSGRMAIVGDGTGSGSGTSGGSGSVGAGGTSSGLVPMMKATEADLPDGCYLNQDGSIECPMDPQTVHPPPGPGNSRPPPTDPTSGGGGVGGGGGGVSGGKAITIAGATTAVMVGLVARQGAKAAAGAAATKAAAQTALEVALAGQMAGSLLGENLIAFTATTGVLMAVGLTPVGLATAAAVGAIANGVFALVAGIAAGDSAQEIARNTLVAAVTGGLTAIVAPLAIMGGVPGGLAVYAGLVASVGANMATAPRRWRRRRHGQRGGATRGRQALAGLVPACSWRVCVRCETGVPG